MRIPLSVIGALVIVSLACGAGLNQATAPPATPLPTGTSVPTPLPPASTPEDLPSDADLRELVLYANAMQPYLAEAGLLLERDGQILKEAEAGNDAVLCDGKLEDDNRSMKAILDGVSAITPPSPAARIHDLVVESGEAWTEALDNVDLFCESGNQFYKVPAALKFWEAAAKLQDAGNRFWLLVVAEGVEDWVQR
jgi:hypothetical protein